jgi:excinuclease ABC subunit C
LSALSQAHILPSKPGVYKFFDSKGTLLYVGKAKDLKKRVASYFANTAFLHAKTAALVEKIDVIDHIITTSEIEAFLLEANLIKLHKPFYNIKLSDDKFFPYIKISKEEIPYVTITRKTDDKNAEYFGPYPNVTSLKVVLKLIRRIFPFESVKNHQKTKCFYNHIGLCPCATVNPEHLPEYKKNIRRIKAFLNGDFSNVLAGLEKDREEHVKQEEFEQASVVQRQIEQVKLVCSEQYDPFRYADDPTLYVTRIRNEKDSLREILSAHYPDIAELDRIECYDISNIQGTNATGSMVVFSYGDADKSQYRRFKIKTKFTPDDFHMMQEVLTRRLKRDDWPKPDLIIIDGGKGQISAVNEVFQKLDCHIPFIGLAKREETIVVPYHEDGKLQFREVKLPHSTPGINLMRRIRDEAHRFAITYHRLLRKKSFLSS